MDRPPLFLRYVRRHMRGDACPLCGARVDPEWFRGYQVALKGSPAPVCDDCIDRHAPELVAARGAANALFGRPAAGAKGGANLKERLLDSVLERLGRIEQVVFIVRTAIAEPNIVAELTAVQAATILAAADRAAAGAENLIKQALADFSPPAAGPEEE
jgi:hypothetical protein